MSIPDNLRRRLDAAITQYGVKPDSLAPVPGGASGAQAYRFSTPDGERLVRLSDPEADRMRNPDQYACLRAAAAAGIAPTVYACEPEQGVLVMDFIPAQPISTHPGGATGAAAALGRLIRSLQAEARFPNVVDFGSRLEGMMAGVQRGGHFTAAVLAPFADALTRLRAAYPWSASAPVAAHGDPNPRNLLFDGERIWLVDWETACAMDPMVDPAILTLESVIGPEAEAAMLEAWLGRPAGPAERDRLALMKPMVRLYYGLLILMVTPPPAEPSDELAPLEPGEFAARVGDGRLPMGSPAMMTELAKITLAGFLADMSLPEVKAVLGRAA